LAIERDIPDIVTILKLLNEELIVEKVAITQECCDNNAPHYNDVVNVYKDMPVMMETISHSVLVSELVYRAKAIIRTGSFTPYGNIVIYPGIDAPKWFERDGVKVPPFYQNRVNK
jgi:D-ribose pyranose/furanose isomerase RbsD